VNQFARKFGPLGLIGVIVFWGATPVMLRELTNHLDAWTTNGVRYPFVAILYWPVLYLGYRRGVVNKDLMKLCIVPAFWSLLGQIMWGLAPYYLKAPAIGFFIRLTLVFSMAAAMVLFADERRLLRQPLFFVGLALCVSGFITFATFGGLMSGEMSTMGVLIMLACSFFFGMYAVSVRHFLRNRSPIFSFAIVAQFVSIGTFTLMLCFGEPSRLLSVNSNGWLLLFASSIVGIGMGHVFLYVAVQRFGATIATGVQTAQPFVTVIVAFLAHGETLNVGQWCAGVGMIFGAVALLISQREAERKAAALERQVRSLQGKSSF
jgi:drug/metabolite transporter (DMT)-like permease